jgi:hypothetical protein
MGRASTLGRFGAIRWETEAHLDDAIRMVRACHYASEAVQLASGACAAGERWAVIDLETMKVLATGPQKYSTPFA